MSAVTESSFWALTAEQMVYLAECDRLDLAESALFGALKRWCLAMSGDTERILTRWFRRNLHQIAERRRFQNATFWRCRG